MMTPDASQRLRLIAVLALIMAPHVLRVPAWVSVLTGAILAWQAVGAWRGWPQPGRWLRLGLALVAFAAVYASFGRVDGQNAGVALLMLMLALKLTEIRRHRDLMVLLSLCFFLLVTHFLFSQSIAMVGLLAAGCLLITACFVDASHPQGALPLRAAFGTAGLLMAQALPVAALLFVLFPRIPGPLWGLPSDSGASARAGLSDSMEPGAISRLALSDAVAFRVRFDGEPPPPSQRYWRGPVFWAFDGRRWTRGQPQRFAEGPPQRRFLDAPVRYRITLEPHRRDWLLALDLPASTPGESHVDAAGSLRTDEPITGRRAFDITSHPSHRLQTNAPAALLDYARRLPTEGNPHARELAKRWRERGLTPAERIDAALDRFSDAPYRYTLEPQTLRGGDRVDAFLFQTREGFCEHYASAFVFLMRAAGLPARVVTGYQGGQPGLGDDYLVVRAADAHAWAEVWLADRGWVRVDPTAAVSPARIETGLGSSLGDDEPVPYLARGAGDLLFRLQMGWDYINAGWNRWFLAYGPQLQTNLMEQLGLPDRRAMLLALTALVTLFLAGLGLVLMRRTREPAPADPVQAAWLRVCRRLAAAGLARAPYEGPLDYAERVAAARPDQAASIRRLAHRYAGLRYRSVRPVERAAFLRDAARFRPGRKPPAARRADGAVYSERQ